MRQSDTRLWSIPPGTPFLPTLAKAVLAGGFPASHMPKPRASELPNYTILVPTRRAARELADAFLNVSDGAALMLPRIRPLGDVDEEELLFSAPSAQWADELDIPPAIPPLRRQLLLARLLLEWARKNPDAQFSRALLSGPSQAIRVAAGLGQLLDQMETEQLQMESLETLVAENFANYWQDVLNVLAITMKQLPEEMARLAMIGPAERRNRLLNGEAERLAALNPRTPLIAAGSTGSIPATANLLRTISQLPNGAVVLPGLDMDLDEESWQALDPQHPQFGLRELLNSLQVDRCDVRRLGQTSDMAGARALLFSEVMRPSQTTELWHRRLPALKAQLPGALRDLSIIRAPARREEALAIALIMRKTIEEPGKTAALITPDRNLGRQVSAQLKRWELDVDDSAGLPLCRTVPGTFIHLILNALESRFSPASLVALFAHPLTRFGLPAGEAARAGRKLELAVLRGIAPAGGLKGLHRALEQKRAEVKNKPHWHPHLAQWDDADWKLSGLAADLIGPAFEHFVSIGAAAWPMRLDVAVNILIKVAETIAGDETDTAANLWTGEAGEQLSQFFASLLEAGRECPLISLADLARVVMELMAQPVVRPRYGTHPRLRILGLLEARLTNHDVIILGALNEKSWPAQTQTDPWLNRPMREDMGLSSPERRIGLSAHDFAQAVCSAGKVAATYCEKLEGNPVVASRWLIRLSATLKALNGPDLEETGRVLVGKALGLDAAVQSSPTQPPAPAPPLEARPARLSVTEIETWLRDPYAIFARHVLKMHPLEELGLAPGPKERGNLFHAIFERFTQVHERELPSDVAGTLAAIAKEHFDNWKYYPEVAAFWWPRFLRICEAAEEIERPMREDSASVHVEQYGKITIPVAGTAGFELSGRADRIDILKDGTARIIDYKTGEPPGITEALSGRAPQLLLEAIMLMRGGFDGLEARAVSDLSYIKLSGADLPIIIRRLDPSEARPKIDKSVDDICQDIFEKLERYIARYLTDASQAYRPRVSPKFEDRPLTYDHLSRYREWADRA